MPTISSLPRPVRWGARSAMNSPYLCAEFTTATSTASETKSPGGRDGLSTLLLRRACSGFRHGVSNERNCFTKLWMTGRNLFTPPIASIAPNFGRMAMPTIQKPQRDHVSFPWHEQSDRFHRELDARRADIFERSGFKKSSEAHEPTAIQLHPRFDRTNPLLRAIPRQHKSGRATAISTNRNENLASLVGDRLAVIGKRPGARQFDIAAEFCDGP